MKRAALAIVATMVLVSCDTSGPVAGPEHPMEVGPQAQIVDGSTTGNAAFYFLSPVGSNPSTEGEFDASLRLIHSDQGHLGVDVVLVCRLLVPISGLKVVPLYSQTVLVEGRQVKLGQGVSLIGGLLEPT